MTRLNKTAAEAIMTMDIIKSAIDFADNPLKLGENLTRQLRGLMAGSNTMLISVIGECDGDYRLLGVCPERKRFIADLEEFRKLICDSI